MNDTKTLVNIKDLESPKGHFVLGHLPQFQTSNKHQVIEQWVKESGELFKVNFAGKEFVISADAKINHEILKLRPEKFRRLSKMNEILLEMGVNGVFNAEGDLWKNQRKPVSEALNVQNIKRFHPVIVNKTELLLKKFKNSINTTIAIRKEFIAFTIDVTTAIAFGYNLDTINNKENNFQEHLEVIFPMINKRITAPIPLWRLIKQKKDKQLEASLKTIKQIIHEFISDAKKRIDQNPTLKENPSNFLEALLVENKEYQFSDDEIYGNIFTMLLAGEDTTSNTISWAVYYLSQNPEIVKKIREEAIVVYKEDDVLTNNQLLSQLTYTNAVIQEVIRLKPTTPQLYFESNEEVIIENVIIPKDTKIILQNKIAQTQEKYFTNADKFIPERWLKSACPMHKNHSPRVIKAFGGGSRFCPGKNLAMTEMLVLISALCKQFDISMTVSPEKVKEQFEFTMYPDNLYVKLQPILSEVN